MNKKILIVDDHPFTRAGVRSILEVNDTIEIVGEAVDGRDAVGQVSEKHPDMVIMDISMPQLSGIEATQEILDRQPDIKVIALSIHSGQRFVKEMLDAGAVGYLLKDEAPDELLKAIEKVETGDMFLSSGVTRAALQKSTESDDHSNIHIVRSKLYPPPVMPDHVIRAKLILELQSNIVKPLSIVSAGAGYGKSIAVSQWLEQTEYLSSWISMDSEHNDVRTFLSYLYTSIENVLPGSVSHTKRLASAAVLPATKEIADIVIDDLCDIEEDYILVLDDYHMIREQKIHDLLDAWLRFPPPCIHLCLITRMDPPLNLVPLRLAGRLTEIRMDQLSFTNSEIEELMIQVVNRDLSAKAIQVLHDKTEGWAIAVTLASMLIKNADDVNTVIDNLEGSMESMSDFLVSEILSMQPGSVQNALVASAILDRFCVDLLDAIFQDHIDIDGSTFSDQLNETNLFVINLDEENKWFRYHHLFQQMLQNQLTAKFNEAEIKTFHLRASQWLERQGFLEEAIDHVLIAKDKEKAAEIIKKHRLDLLEEADYYLLERLLRRIPAEYIEADPELLLVDLNIQWNHDNFIAIGQLLEKVHLVMDRLEEDSHMHGELSFFKGFTSLFLKGDLKTALACFEIAKANIPESSSGPRGVLEVISMIFNQMGGFYDEVKKEFYELIDRDLPPIRKYRIYEGYIAASIDQLNAHEIEANYLKSISHTRNFQMKEPLGAMLTISAMYLVRKGVLATAVEYWEEAKDLRYLMHSRIAVDTLSGLVIVYSLMDEKIKSAEIIKVLDRYISSLGDYFNVFLWSATIRFHMINQDHEAVKNLLPKYKPHVLDLVVYVDIPEITHARALIFEGSANNLERAEEELAQLAEAAAAINNCVHLYEVKVLQAILYDVKGEMENAEEALLASLEIAEPEGIKMYYVELGNLFTSLIKNMPETIQRSPFVSGIIEEIEGVSVKKKEIKSKEVKEKLNVLTNSELKVLDSVAEGLRNHEIAEKLFVTEETIKKHIYHMFQKLQVKNRLSLVSKAKEAGILK